jgi:group I intron endonuclease
MLICRALSKYGYSGFSLEILECCEPSVVLKREKYYFKLLKPEYNISQEPSSPFLGRKHSDETRAALSGKNHPLFEKPRPEETRAKISASKKGIPKSVETKAKMSASKVGNSYSKNQPNSLKIVVTDLELDTKTTYNSIRAAAKAINLQHSIISKYFKNNRIKPFRGRYVFTK